MSPGWTSTREEERLAFRGFHYLIRMEPAHSVILLLVLRYRGAREVARLCRYYQFPASMFLAPGVAEYALGLR